MEWESEASGKPIPTNGAGPDVKTIRRLMDRLVTAGKARILKVETPGFLGDNRPVSGTGWVGWGPGRGLEVTAVDAGLPGEQQAGAWGRAWGGAGWGGRDGA